MKKNLRTLAKVGLGLGTMYALVTGLVDFTNYYVSLDVYGTAPHLSSIQIIKQPNNFFNPFSGYLKLVRESTNGVIISESIEKTSNSTSVALFADKFGFVNNTPDYIQIFSDDANISLVSKSAISDSKNANSVYLAKEIVAEAHDRFKDILISK